MLLFLGPSGIVLLHGKYLLYLERIHQYKICTWNKIRRGNNKVVMEVSSAFGIRFLLCRTNNIANRSVVFIVRWREEKRNKVQMEEEASHHMLKYIIICFIGCFLWFCMVALMPCNQLSMHNMP